MGIELPGELANLLNELGYTWPKADETALLTLGREWITFGGQLRPLAQDASRAVADVVAHNHGPALTAMEQVWRDGTSAVAVLEQGAAGADAIGGALLVCAAVVLALKVNVIVQVTTLLIEIAQAIATAPATFGASLLEVPVFKKIADLAINFLINQAIGAILG